MFALAAISRAKSAVLASAALATRGVAPSCATCYVRGPLLIRFDWAGLGVTREPVTFLRLGAIHHGFDVHENVAIWLFDKAEASVVIEVHALALNCAFCIEILYAS